MTGRPDGVPDADAVPAGPDSPLRVLVVTNLYPTAAAPAQGIFVKLQVEALRRTGLDVRVLHVDRAAGGRRAYLRLRRSVGDAVDELRPDLVHVRYGGVIAQTVTGAVTDRPVVLTFCGSDLLASRARTHGLARLSSLYGVLASRRAAARADAIVVVSEGLAAALPARVDGSRVSVIPDGVDLEEFTPREQGACRSELGWDPAARHVVFPAARTRPEKRFALAEAAVERVRAGGRRVELHELAGRSRSEVCTWLNAADALVLTSTHEGSPNVVKEALACDLPVVSVDVGDVRERIEGIEGCFIADATAEDVAAKLARVLERGARVQARERVEEVSIDRVALRLEGVYRSVTGRR